MIQTQSGRQATHLHNRYKGSVAFLITDERTPEELAKLDRRGILIIAADDAKGNPKPHIWFCDDPQHHCWRNPSIMKISKKVYNRINSFVSSETMSDVLKCLGISQVYHVGHSDSELDTAIEDATQHLPKYDKVAGLYY